MSAPRQRPRRYHWAHGVLLLLGILVLAAHGTARWRQTIVSGERLGASQVQASLRRHMRHRQPRPMAAARAMADALTDDDRKTVSAATTQLAWQLHLDRASSNRHATRFWQLLADQLLAKQAPLPWPGASTSAREAAIAMLSSTAARRNSAQATEAELSSQVDSCLAMLTCFEKHRERDRTTATTAQARRTGLAKTFDRESRHRRGRSTTDTPRLSIADQFQIAGGGLPTEATNIPTNVERRAR